jgi:hypothetical protein
MDQAWEEVTSGEHVVDALGLGDVGVPALERLLLAPDSDRYLRVEADGAPPAGEFGYLVPGTRYFFNVTACRELRGDAAVALAAYLATQSAPVAATAAALRKLADNLTRLSDDELVVVRAIMRACPGNPYEVAVTEDDVRERFRGDTEQLDDLLDALQSKGVIGGRRRGRVQLVY